MIKLFLIFLFIFFYTKFTQATNLIEELRYHPEQASLWASRTRNLQWIENYQLRHESIEPTNLNAIRTMMQEGKLIERLNHRIILDTLSPLDAPLNATFNQSLNNLIHHLKPLNTTSYTAVNLSAEVWEQDNIGLIYKETGFQRTTGSLHTAHGWIRQWQETATHPTLIKVEGHSGRLMNTFFITMKRFYYGRQTVYFKS